MKYFVFTILLFIIIFSSCKKDKSIPSPQNNNIDTSYINNLTLIFNPGSYWIYSDTLSLAEDSIAIINKTHLFKLVTNSAYTQVMEYYTLSYKNFTNNNSYCDNYFACWVLRNNCNQMGSYGEYAQQIFLGPNNGCGQIGGEHGGCKFLSYFDSLKINNKWFQNVYQMRITKSQQSYNYFSSNTDLYFSPNIGIIRTDDFDSSFNVIQRKNLIRWNVIQ